MKETQVTRFINVGASVRKAEEAQRSHKKLVESDNVYNSCGRASRGVRSREEP